MEKRGRGRPPGPTVEVDLKQLEQLGRLHCTVDEAAAFYGVTKRTMLRYLDPETNPENREAWERGQHAGKMSLRRLQWRHANGSGSSAVTMTIHLSKHWLGETEKSLVEMSGKDGQPIEHKHINDDAARFTEAIITMAARRGGQPEQAEAEDETEDQE